MLVVIKDYESAFDAVTIINSLADFQPLSIAQINIFHQQPRFYRQIYHSVKEEIPRTNYDLLIRCMTAPVSVDSQV